MLRSPDAYRQIHCQRQRSTVPVVGLQVLLSSCERGPGRLANSVVEAWASKLEVVDGGEKLRQPVEGFWNVQSRCDPSTYVTFTKCDSWSLIDTRGTQAPFLMAIHGQVISKRLVYTKSPSKTISLHASVQTQAASRLPSIEHQSIGIVPGG